MAAERPDGSRADRAPHRHARLGTCQDAVGACMGHAPVGDASGGDALMGLGSLRCVICALEGRGRIASEPVELRREPQ
jgi:hypothetical protein